MRIVVTGAGGFVGRHVLKALSDHQVVALDINLESIADSPNVTKIEGDLQNPAILEAAFKKGCDAIIHLATVPGGASEIHPALAKSVNIDATMSLIERATKLGNCPRFVFASSIAVFGKLPNTPVIDEAPVQPTMLYGAHKLMMENWIATQTRRGAIHGISLRLPGIVARPKSPSGMKSAFLSDIFHALRDGNDFTMPVAPNSTTWLCSVKTAAKNIVFCAIGPDNFKADGEPILVPALRVNVTELEQEIRRQIGSSTSKVQYSADENLQSIFAGHPDIQTTRALKMGFVADTDLRELVKAAL